MSKSKDKDASFEDAMERLETLVEEMESGDLSLDQMLAHFEEGSKLVTSCSGKLDEIERKIDILVKKDGKLATEPFDESDE